MLHFQMAVRGDLQTKAQRCRKKKRRKRKTKRRKKRKRRKRGASRKLVLTVSRQSSQSPPCSCNHIVQPQGSGEKPQRWFTAAPKVQVPVR